MTVGKGHLAFWLIDLPRKGKPGANRGRDASSKPPYEYQKRLPTYTPHKAPSATHAVAFVHRDDAVVTGASDGRVYIWRDFKVVHHFEAHGLGSPCLSLQHADGFLFTGGGDGLVKRWRLDKGRYKVVASSRPATGQEKRAKFPTSKAPISAVFHSFRLIFGRAIISRNGLEAWMLLSERARAEHSR